MLWAARSEVHLLHMLVTHAAQELEQAGVKPQIYVPDTTDADLVDVEAAPMLTQLVCDTSTTPMHLVLLESHLKQYLVQWQ